MTGIHTLITNNRDVPVRHVPCYQHIFWENPPVQPYFDPVFAAFVQKVPFMEKSGRKSLSIWS